MPRKSLAPKIPIADLRLTDTHRLIPARASVSGTVLSRLADDPESLALLMELDDATNDRFLGEDGLLPGIGIHELVYGIRYAHIVNAAFAHPAPAGARFNSATRGAWYASLDRDTAIVEVAFYKLLHLNEIDWPHPETAVFDIYLADITSPMHDLRPGDPDRALPATLRRYLAPSPIPECYADSQQLASTLLDQQSNGIIYPSVRRPGGECLACFRPALVYNVRRHTRLELPLTAKHAFHPADARELPNPEA